MTHTTHPLTPGRRTGWQVLAAAVIALVIALAAIVGQRTQPDAFTGQARGEPPAAVVHAPEGLAAYAQAHDLTGGSPAGLQRRHASMASSSTPTGVYEIYRDIARYANANGLTGLSPAGLAPVARRAGR